MLDRAKSYNNLRNAIRQILDFLHKANRVKLGEWADLVGLLSLSAKLTLVLVCWNFCCGLTLEPVAPVHGTGLVNGLKRKPFELFTQVLLIQMFAQKLGSGEAGVANGTVVRLLFLVI